MKKNINLRSLAAQAIEQVVEKGQSLSNVLPPLQQKVSDKDKALLQELCFGVLRTLSQLEWLISKLMARPMTGKQRTVHFLIMVGLYQLLYTRIPPHAALAETVEGAVAIKRPQLKGLINGVLRQFQRQQEALLAEFAEHENRYLHPKWLLKRLQQASRYNGKVVTVTRGIEPLAMKHNDHGHAYDPHVWQDPERVKQMVGNIAEALSAADPAGAAYYRTRAADYRTQIGSLLVWAQNEIASVPAAKRVVLTSHDAFGYLGQRFGIRLIQLILRCARQRDIAFD